MYIISDGCRKNSTSSHLQSVLSVAFQITSILFEFIKGGWSKLTRVNCSRYCEASRSSGSTAIVWTLRCAIHRTYTWTLLILFFFRFFIFFFHWLLAAGFWATAHAFLFADGRANGLLHGWYHRRGHGVGLLHCTATYRRHAGHRQGRTQCLEY